ncbi:MAG: DUF3488 and transglutaminase-like domain-containing protein [Myxococcaceae bacterium]
MRLASRQVLRLRMRDLTAASAFAAVALSGTLPPWVPVVFLVALVVSLIGWRPFSRQPVISVVALLAIAVVLFGLVFRGALDLVVAAVSFATLVTAQRMLTEPATATDQQVLLSSLLLIAGAAALSGNAAYAVCLFFFGVFGCLALGLTVVEGPIERDEELPMAPVLRQISLGVAFALVGGLAFFVLFPRLSWNVAARRSGPGLIGGTTGMTDRVRLGGAGDIKTSARVVMRATLEPRPDTERLERYWVGRRFDLFDGREWRGTGEPQRPRMRIFIADGTDSVVQRIELLPGYESRTLVGLEQPVIYGNAAAIGTSGTVNTSLQKVGSEEVRFVEDANAYSYVVYSRSDVVLTESDPQVLAALSALPDQLDPRIAKLAGQIVGTTTDPEDVARNLEGWLRSNLAYSLELGGDVADPLADFLFVRKAGHCEHFATALAVMLRTRGVPARVVGGFYGGELVGEKYVVRAGDAHAWVEAYSPQRGWRTFDATPEDARASQPRALVARLVDTWERLEELWRAKVIDYSLIDQFNLVKGLVKPPQSQGSADDDDPKTGSSRVTTPDRALWIAVLVGALVFVIVWRLGQKRTPRHPAADFLTALEKRLVAAGVPYRDGEDIETLPHRLALERHRLATPVAHASRRYLEARFGGRALNDAERRRLLEQVSLS